MSENGDKAKLQAAAVPYQWLARIYAITPDGTQWEARLVAVAQFPDGIRELASIKIRSCEGGLEMLRAIIPTGAQLAVQLATQQISGLVISKV